MVAVLKGLPKNAIKCMALAESHPLAFQMEEFAWNLRDHIAIRTVIRYRNGVLRGRGASLLDGYMEDLATDRICRLMIAQRMRHARQAEILDARGTAVEHTPELIGRLFDEELDRLLQDKEERRSANSGDASRSAPNQ